MARSGRLTKYQPATRCGRSGKTSFRSTVAARAFLNAVDEWRGETARVYQCPFCSWFHLTSARTLWELARLQKMSAYSG